MLLSISFLYIPAGSACLVNFWEGENFHLFLSEVEGLFVSFFKKCLRTLFLISFDYSASV